MNGMNSIERLNVALKGQETDHIPFSHLFESLPNKYKNLGHMGFCKFIGADLLNRFASCSIKFALK